MRGMLFSPVGVVVRSVSSPEPLGLICNRPRDQETSGFWGRECGSVVRVLEWAAHFRIMAWKILLSFVIEMSLFFTFDVYGSGVRFSNTWAVKVRGGGIEKIAYKHGFVNETQVREKRSSPLFKFKVIIFKCREKGLNMGAREKCDVPYHFNLCM